MAIVRTALHSRADPWVVSLPPGVHRGCDNAALHGDSAARARPWGEWAPRARMPLWAGLGVGVLCCGHLIEG
ncbi:MAG: hypothetical protein V9F04_05070 [Dermatophilaceae bacterium]